MSRFTPFQPGIRRWYFAAIVLVVFYLGVAALSLFVHQRVASTHEAVLSEGVEWSERFSGIARLADEISTLRAAAGSELDSEPLASYRRRLSDLDRTLDLEAADVGVARAATSAESGRFSESVAEVRKILRTIQAQIDVWTAQVQTESPEQHRSRSAVIERECAKLLQSYFGLREAVAEVQATYYRSQLEAAALLRNLEFGIAALLFAVAVGSVVFTRNLLERLGNDAEQEALLREELRDAQQKYRDIFENAVEGIFQSTPDGRFLTVNQALASMCGYETPQELISGVHSIGTKLFVDRARLAELMQLLEGAEAVLGFEAEMYRRDGSTMWVSENIRAVRDEQGLLLYLEGTMEDISERRRAERRRQLHEATARVFAEAATVAEARPKVLKAVCELLEWEMGAVWDVDSESNVLRCIEVWHRPEIDIEEFEAATARMTLEPGTGLAGSVWRNGEPAWIQLSGESQPATVRIAAKNGMNAGFGVAIKVSGKVFYVLEFFCPKASPPDPELMRLLGAIGVQLGNLIERKRAEEALRESEARKAAILESALDCIITFDHKGVITEFNPAAERTFGFARPEALGRRMEELIVPESLHARTRQAGGGSAEGVPRGMVLGRRVELMALRSDRSEFPIEMAISRVVVNGHPMFTAYVRDVTEQKRAERVRLELASVVEYSNDAVVGLTLDGVILSWNSGAERIYGYTAGEVIGRPVYKLVPPERVDELPRTLAAVRRGESVANFETIRLRKDGRKIAVSLTESPIRDERGAVSGISSIARDITENKRLEEQLLQAQKMEAVGRLAGGVAHDFNNILTAILGYSDLMLRQVDPTHKSYKNLSEIRHAAEFAASLTHQLLAFSRRQTLELKVIDVNDVVNNIKKMLRRLIGENINILSVPDPRIGWIKADPGQLEQVILNLAVNARDAMPKGGVLTIETANVRYEPDDVFHQTEIPPGLYTRLTVSDTGCGMTDEVRTHIFEPFFTTKDKGQGTGLGLATCYGIIKQSGGYITVESVPGQGATFHIYFPQVAEENEVAASSGDAAKALPHGTETILLVEDEVGVRKLAGQILRKLGYKVLDAEDGEQAKRVFESGQQKIDLLLADVVLPRSSGKELADWAQRLDCRTKILFTSGYVEENVFRHHGLEPGMPFLQKPFTPMDLARKVREILDHPQPQVAGSGHRREAGK